MKKFKSTLERQVEVERQELDQFLDQRNLIKSVFWDYCRWQWGALFSVMMLLNACLVNGFSWRPEYVVLIFAGLAYVSGLSALNYWHTYWNKPILLRHKHNTFVAKGKIPAFLLGLFMFIVLPLGWSTRSLGLVLIALALLYARPLQTSGIAWREVPGLRALLSGLMWAGLAAIPVVSAVELKQYYPLLFIGLSGLVGAAIGSRWRWV